MKISLRNSILFIMVIFVSCLYAAEVCFEDSMLGKLPPKVANYILHLAEYQQMCDNRNVIRYDEYQNLAMCKLESMKCESKFLVKCPRFSFLGYLDSSKQLCLVTKNEKNQEETSFIKLSDFDESFVVNESENLLEKLLKKIPKKSLISELK